MAKLYFRHGAMGSSKTANALMVEYNYYETYKDTILEYDYNLKEDSYVYLNSYYYNNTD